MSPVHRCRPFASVGAMCSALRQNLTGLPFIRVFAFDDFFHPAQINRVGLLAQRQFKKIAVYAYFVCGAVFSVCPLSSHDGYVVHGDFLPHPFVCE